MIVPNAQTIWNTPRPGREAAPIAEVPFAHAQAIVGQLAPLDRELSALGFPMAGARSAEAEEQIGHDLSDKLHVTGRLWLDEPGDELPTLALQSLRANG